MQFKLINEVKFKREQVCGLSLSNVLVRLICRLTTIALSLITFQLTLLGANYNFGYRISFNRDEGTRKLLDFLFFVLHR